MHTSDSMPRALLIFVNRLLFAAITYSDEFEMFDMSGSQRALLFTTELELLSSAQYSAIVMSGCFLNSWKNKHCLDCFTESFKLFQNKHIKLVYFFICTNFTVEP